MTEKRKKVFIEVLHDFVQTFKATDGLSLVYQKLVIFYQSLIHNWLFACLDTPFC